MKSDHDAPMRRRERLSHLRDYEVARQEPDPRGWTVVNGEGQAVGEVKDLVVDTERMAATHLDVELDTKRFDLRDDDPHVLVPVERAHSDGKHVVVDDISSGWVGELRAAREQRDQDFWDRWWHRDEPSREGGLGSRHPAVANREAGFDTRISRRGEPAELNRLVDEVRPGEAVRIPVVEEEIVVERRPVVRDDIRDDIRRDDRVINRTPDDEAMRRRR